MDLFVPKVVEGHKSCPCIVWICGGAFMMVDHAVWMPEMLRFARAGYVVASIEYRTTNEAPFPAQLIDCKSAIRYLRAHAKEFCIDPSRIFVMGESAGGTMACLLGTTAGHSEFDQGDWLEYSSAVQGVVDFYGVTQVDPIEKSLGPVPHWAFDAFISEGFTHEDGKIASAVEYVSPATPPVLFLHGSQDPLVKLEQSERFYEALTNCGVPTDFLILEGASHGDDLFYQDEIVERILAFMEKL
ncbi:MAG: alpha/beta hydrolase [Oscillospiraceae bacterium]|nr:alpha/beta hydrolase [Oscillospiraceae bacterium]